MRNTTLGFLALTLAVAVILGLPGAGLAVVGATAPRVGGSVTVIRPFIEPGLNPIVHYERGVELLFDPLVFHDMDQNVKPALAERWKISDDGLVYTFYLRKGAKWSDGREISADDVVFTFDKLFDPEVVSVTKGWFTSVLDSWKALDKYTVQFKAKMPAAPLINYFAMQRIAPKHVLQSLTAKEINSGDFNRNPTVTSGPFKWGGGELDGVFTLLANEDYYFKRGENNYRHVPYLERLVFKNVPDRRAIVLELRTSENAAYSLRMSKAEYDELKTLPNVNVTVVPAPMGISLNVNNQHPLFSDKRVRQAMTYAIDRDTIVNTRLKGIAHVKNSEIISNHWAYEPGVKRYGYDPEKAKQLLAEAGWKPGRDGILAKDGLRFSFEVMAHPSDETVDAIQHYLKAVGIDMKIRYAEWGVMQQSQMSSDFVATIYHPGWQYFPDRRHLYHSEAFPPRGQNFLRYKNPQLDRVLDKAYTSFNRDEQKKLYSEMQKILAEDMPAVYIWDVLMITAANKNIHGIQYGIFYYTHTAPLWWVEE